MSTYLQIQLVISSYIYNYNGGLLLGNKLTGYIHGEERRVGVGEYYYAGSGAHTKHVCSLLVAMA